MTQTTDLRFGGSLWCNIDIALRNIDSLFRQAINPPNLTVIEWYILRALYESDGQHASELARAVGRAATSFTPNLDKLQKKGFIERRPDRTDRRAVRIYLTEKGEEHREVVQENAREVDEKLYAYFTKEEINTFLNVLEKLQNQED